MFFITSIHYFTFSLCLLFHLLVVFCAYPSFSSHLDKDLKTLSRLLPGFYSNEHQYAVDITNELPSSRRHLSLQTVIRPVHVPFLENSFAVYVEQYLNRRRNKPFKQWLYSFQVDQRERAIRMRNLLFRDPEKLKWIGKKLENIQDLKENDVFSRRSCDMIWRKLKKQNYHGATGRDCVAYINGEKLRIEVSASLSPKSLQWQEGWFKVKDGSSSVATVGPYIMKKVQKIQNVVPYRKHLTMTKTALPYQHLNVVGRYADKSRNHVPSSDAGIVTQKTAIWNLDTFDEIKDKLMAGRSVYVLVDGTGCSKSGFPNPSRFNFGAKIENFEISVDKRKFHGDLLKFASFKKILHENDVKNILREVKVYRDGTVIIDYYVIDSFTNHVTQQAMAVCTLFNSDTRKGQVKLTSDPFKLVKPLKSFGALRSSLKKGRDVKMVADLRKCSNLQDKTTIIGGELKDYDFLESGDITVTLSTIYSNMETESMITSYNNFAVFSKNNRMTLTFKVQNISKNFSDFFLNKTIKHRCIIGKNNSKYGLSLFYS